VPVLFLMSPVISHVSRLIDRRRTTEEAPQYSGATQFTISVEILHPKPVKSVSCLLPYRCVSDSVIINFHLTQHISRAAIVISSYPTCFKPSALFSMCSFNTRWFKYYRDDLRVNKSQFVPVIFEPFCSCLGSW
jgi:hypothetical protein